MFKIDPRLNLRDHLVRYQLKSGRTLGGRRVAVVTQFGPQTLALTHAGSLCVPSTKKVFK